MKNISKRFNVIFVAKSTSFSESRKKTLILKSQTFGLRALGCVS